MNCFFFINKLVFILIMIIEKNVFVEISYII
jgi:hypothetical protein